MTCHGVGGAGSGAGIQQTAYQGRGGGNVPLTSPTDQNLPPDVAALRAYLQNGQTPQTRIT